MQLYGVEHYHEIEVHEKFRQAPYVPPPNDLIEQIESLPYGTSIGLGVCSEQLNGISVGVISNQATRNYWNTIYDACLSSNHEVIFMDDVEYDQQISKFLSVSSSVEEYNHGIPDKSDQVTRRLKEISHAFLAAAQYTRRIIRQDNIVETLAYTSPDVAILDVDESDYLSATADTFGIEVDDYLRSKTDFFTDDEGNFLGGIQTLEEYYYLNDSLHTRETISRLYRAVKEGRVTEHSIPPQLIGTTTPYCPPKGFFEVRYFPNAEQPTLLGEEGFIYDALGDAKFSVKDRDNGLIFIKSYISGLGSLVLNGQDIIYIGEQTAPGTYSGQFASLGDGVELALTEGNFHIKPSYDDYKPINPEEIVLNQNGILDLTQFD